MWSITNLFVILDKRYFFIISAHKFCHGICSEVNIINKIRLVVVPALQG